MRKIFPLSPEIITKIAAGEVIERPAYAVKELVENAIDANATWIKIDIEQSGLKSITVLDNGDGMNEEDILLSFKPHTTSKLKEEDSLIGVKTLGFRGEALSSIASISNLTIQSKEHNSTAGTEVVIRAGRLEKSGPVGVPYGTKIIVEDLFYPVPARKKFLKSPLSEWRVILDIVSNFALLFTKTRFTLTHNKKIIFDLSNDQTFDDRVKLLIGESVYKHLLPFQFEESIALMNGFIGKPEIALSNPTKQLLFVNGRRVSDKLINTAVKQAFGPLLPGHYYPVFLINLIIPHEMVDVNVHPRKEQIKFLNPQQVFDAVQKGIYQALLNYNLTYSTGKTTFSSTALKTGELLKENIQSWNVFEDELDAQSEVLQIHNLYLLIQTKNGVRIYDQHACHERILYEQFLEEFKKQKKISKSLTLKKTISIQFSLAEAELLKQNLELINKLGFEIVEFMPQHFKISKVPELFIDRDLSQFIRELLANSEDYNTGDVDSVSDEIIQYLACKSAIKAGDKLTEEQSKRLINKLEKTPNKATCPHGRPTSYSISLSEINKQFKR
jgi:DNA mismatch repair protein MutL